MTPPTDSQSQRTKVFGVGLNKTGTKTLAKHLRNWGYCHRSYDSDVVHESPSFRLYAAGRKDELVAKMREFDSCEDWPWPLLFRELDEAFPDARFVLTRRADSDTWFRSLCNMAVRIGPFPLYEKAVYGYGMPQGRKEEHVSIYEAHNEAVRERFADRPGKLLEICWEEPGDHGARLAEFLGLEVPAPEAQHVNRSPGKVYSGDNLLMAHAHRLYYQRIGGPQALGRRIARKLGLVGRSS